MIRMISEKLVDSILLYAFNGSLVKNDTLLERVNIKAKDISGYFEIPDNWIWVKLDDIIDLQQGVQIDTCYQKNEEFPNSIKFLRIINFTQNMDDMRWVDKKFISQKSIVSENDLVMVRYGATSGNIYYATDGLLANNLFKININNDEVFQKYIYYYFKSNFIKLKILGDKGDTAMPSINFTSMRKIDIPLPPLEEQKRIIDKIENILNKLEEIYPIENELSELKKEFPVMMSKSIILEGLKGKLTKQRENEKVDASNIKITMDINHPFEIPDNWIWVSHNDLFEIIGGSQPPKSKFSTTKKENYIQLYQTRDYGPNPQPVYVDKNDVSKFTKKGDIVLARYGGSLGKVFWAEDGAYNVALAKVVIKYPELINKKYLYYYYLADLYQSKVKSGNRSAQAGFSKEDLAELPFPLPPIEEQQRIVEKIEQLLPLCNDIEFLVNE